MENTDTKITALKTWLQRFMRSESYVAPYVKSGRENYKLYRAYKDGADKVYKHDIFVPYSFAFMEDMVAYFLLSVTASPETFSLEPRWNSVSIELCRHLEKIISWVLTDERTEFALELEEMLKSLNIYNAAYLVNYVSTQEDPVKDAAGSVAHRADGSVIKADTYDYLYLDSPHPFNVFPEPGPKRLSRSGWVVKRSFETIENLRRGQREGVYKDVEDIVREGSTGESDPVEALLSEIGMASVKYNENRIELLDCFSDGDVATIANRRAVIRDTTQDMIRPYSFRYPMLDCRFSGAPGEWFGVGSIEATKPLQKELNLLRSQRRDNVSLVLNKLFQYDMLAGEVDLTTLFTAPGNVIVTQGDALKELPIQDITGSSYREEQSLVYDIQNTLSFFDYTRGATPRRRETATGIIRLQQAAQSRMEWHLRKLDAYVLQPLCRRILVYIRECLPREAFAAIVGPDAARQDQANGGRSTIQEFYDLSTEDIKRLISVRPLTESISSVKEVDQAQFMQAFDRLIRLPEINKPALIKQLLIKLGQRNLKDIIPQLSPGAQAGTVQGIAQAKERPMAAPPVPGMPVGMSSIIPRAMAEEGFGNMEDINV